MKTELASRNIVLLGIGHTNAHILKMWRMAPIRDSQLICVSNFPTATYSGMFPGVLAGQYKPDEMRIDLVRLCKSVAATLIIDEVTGLDLPRQQVQFANRSSLPFDVLSIGIGSMPDFAGVDVTQSADTLVPIKPMQTFLQRLDGRITTAIRELHDQPLRIVVVGAGVGGCEIAMCLPAHLRQCTPQTPLQMTIIHAQPEILSGLNSKTVSRVRRVMQDRSYELVTSTRAVRVDTHAVQLDSGRTISADIVIWATGAVAPPLLPRLGLSTDDRGFILTRKSLQVLDDSPIFAVGDSGTIQQQPTPKAGVFAVRQGPVLWDNLSNLLDQRPLQEYKPQAGFLKLMNSGDDLAIGEYKGLSFRGKWGWRWKDHIDRKFMTMFQDYRIAEMSPGPAPRTQRAKLMRCAGCGGKVSGRVLSAALKELSITKRPEIVMGLDQPDDTAVLNWAQPGLISVTTDFFQLPLEDPHISGRIAALNALSDIWAMGAVPIAALATVVLPSGTFLAQKRFLSAMLAGGVSELERAATTLVGGHTIEGDSPIFGFTILAQQPGDLVTAKGNMRPGDRVLLSKPLGSGILLAGHMQAKCKAAWMQDLLTHLLQSNQPAAEFAAECKARSVTDVTGFGLAGHLLEMMNASGVDIQLDLANLRLIDGVVELIGHGVESTLAPANRDVENQIRVSEPQRRAAEYTALFDPQTNGGLLIALGEQEYRNAEIRLHAEGFMTIGRVSEQSGDQPQLICS